MSILISNDIKRNVLNNYNSIFTKYINGSLSNKEKQRFINLLIEKHLLDKSNKDIPLEYVFEKGLFMGNVFKCTPKTFIPRKDTELLVQQTLRFIPENKKNIIVFDIGTGTGNIAITLVLQNKNIHVFSSDISKDALKIANENITHYNLHDKITLLCGEMFIPHQIDLNGIKANVIICNPPYIPTKKLQNMSPEIINFEPVHAFDGGPYGLNIFRKLINCSPDFLIPGGTLLFEFGSGQDGLVKKLFFRNGQYKNINFYEYNNEKRVVSAQYYKESF